MGTNNLVDKLLHLKNNMNNNVNYLFQVIETLNREMILKQILIDQLLPDAPSKFYCPICNFKLKYFNPLPLEYKESAERYGYQHYGHGEMTSVDTYSCPNCGASDRERLYALWLNSVIGSLLLINSKMIHFAPESSLQQWLKLKGVMHYKTADLLMSNVDLKVDITNLPFSDNEYDFFICSHVLEHVSNDRQAVNELYRITKRGGMGILMAPIALGLEHTLHDPNITDPNERWRLYGQDDHVRLYAHNDYVDVLKTSGFIVSELGINYFGESSFKALGLKPTSILYVVQKPE
jgi:rubredoxin